MALSPSNTPSVASYISSSQLADNFSIAEKNRSISTSAYLALSEIPWTWAYVGFVCYMAVITTYLANIGALAMGAALFSLFFSPRPIYWPSSVKLMVLFGAVAGLSTLLSEYSADSKPFLELGKTILIFIVAINVLRSRFALRSFLLFYLACFSLFPVRGTFFNYFVYDNTYFGRASWISAFSNPNDLAVMAILALAIATSFLHSEVPRLLRAIALILCVILPVTVLLSQSRGAFIGMSVFFLCAILSLRKYRSHALVAIVVTAILVVVIAPAATLERITGLLHATDTSVLDTLDPYGLEAERARIAIGSANERLEIALTGVKIFMDHPILGVGLWQSQAAHNAYNPAIGFKNLHNTYLEIATETGIFGLVIFFSIILSLLFEARRTRLSSMHLVAMGDWRRLQLIEYGLLGYLVSGIWGTYGYINMMYVYLAILSSQTHVLGTLSSNLQFADHAKVGKTVNY